MSVSFEFTPPPKYSKDLAQVHSKFTDLATNMDEIFVVDCLYLGQRYLGQSVTKTQQTPAIVLILSPTCDRPSLQVEYISEMQWCDFERKHFGFLKQHE